jgi:hypothetical protein
VTGFGSVIFIRGALPMLPGHIRVIPIALTSWPDEATRTSNSACVWIAEATVEGRTYTARSRHGPANQLARQACRRRVPRSADGHPHRGLEGTMTYRSFHAAATWTFSGQRRFALALMGRRRDALWRPHAGLKALRFRPPRIA